MFYLMYIDKYSVKTTILKKTLKIGAWIMGVILGLLLLLALIIQIPAVQNTLLRRVCTTLSAQTGTEISIERIYLGFFHTLKLKGIYVEDLNQDTLLYDGRLAVDLNMLALISQRVEVNELELNRVNIQLYRGAADTTFNYQFLIDAFSGEKTEPKEPAPNEWTIRLNQIRLRNTRLRMLDERSGSDLDTRIGLLQIGVKNFDLQAPSLALRQLQLRDSYVRYAQLPSSVQGKNLTKTTTSDSGAGYPQAPLPLSLDRLILANNQFIYTNENKVRNPKVLDFNHLNLSDLDLDARDFSWQQDSLQADIQQLSVADHSGFKINKFQTVAFFGDQQIRADDLLLRTPQSNIQLNYTATYDSFSDWATDLAGRVQMQFELDNTSIAFQDLGYFAPSVQEIKQINTSLTRTILAKASAKGTLEQLQNFNINLSIANDLRLIADGRASELTTPQALQYQVRLRELSTSYDQLKNLTRNVSIPGGLDSLGQIRLSGRFRGGLDSVRGANIQLRTSSATRFTGDLSAQNLQSKSPIIFALDIGELQTQAADIAGFSTSDLPAEVYRLGQINYSGRIEGNQFDISSNGRLQSEAGAVQTNARILFNKDYSNANYQGDIRLDSFNLGYMLQDSSIGTTTLALKGQGKGLQADSLQVDLAGTVESFTFRDYRYEDLQIDGLIQQNLFAGNATFDDPNLSFDFSGEVNLKDSLAALQFEARIDTLNLAELKLGDLPYAFSGSIKSDFTGLQLNDLDGQAQITDFYISNDTSSYYGDTLQLRAAQLRNGQRLRLQAPFVDFQIEGAYEPAQLPQLVRNYVNDYFPVDELLPAEDQPDSLTIQPQMPPSALPDQNFSASLVLLDPVPLLRIFSPLVQELDSAKVQFSFSSQAKDLDLQARIPHLKIAGQAMDSLQINLAGSSERLKTQLRAQQINYGMDRPLSDLLLESRLGNDSLTLQLTALENGQESKRKKLAFSGNATETNGTYRFSFGEDFFLNNQNWKVNPNNEWLYRSDFFDINQFSLTNQQQKLALRAEDQSNNRALPPLRVSFNDFRISEILKLLQLQELEYEGAINGFVVLRDYTENLNYLADLRIDDILLNEQAVGNLRLEAAQESNRKPLIRLNAALKGPEGNLNATGTYAINNQYLDLDASFEDLKVRLLDPFLFGLIRESRGKVEGQFAVKGPTNAPQIVGDMRMDSVSTIFGISGVRYTILNETLNFDNSRINFSATELQDANGNRAYLDGYLDISDFGDVGLGLDFQTSRFQILNTSSEDEELYYGTLFVAADVGLRGSALNPIINMQASTLAPSQLFVQPLSIDQAVASQQDYIIYGNPMDYEPQDSSETIEEVYQLDRNGIDLTLNMEVTPEAELQVIIDPATGDKLVCRGNAEATVRMQPNGQLDILGNYRITDGRYALNYQGILKKDFEIEPGSRLDFVGDPLATRFDITAIYSTQTPTFELIRNRLTDENSPEALAAKRRKQVDVILSMEGDLNTPDISFDIQIPDNGAIASATRQELQRIRENNTELNKQVFSLLLLNSFLSEQSGGGDLADAGASVYLSSVSSLLTNQLNRLADNYLKGVDVNIGIDSYQSAYDLGDSGNTVTELNLGVSKQLFNDRLSLKVGGNVNLNSENTSLVEGANFSSIAGDFVLEYKLTEAGNVRLRVFRRDNYDVLNQNNVPQTGVGISFSKSFGDVNKKKEEKK